MEATLATIVAATLAFMVQIESPAQIAAGWTSLGYEGTALGYAELVKTPCVIHVPPLTPETLWIWTHEIKHCELGHWHPWTGKGHGGLD